MVVKLKEKVPEKVDNYDLRHYSDSKINRYLHSMNELRYLMC